MRSIRALAADILELSVWRAECMQQEPRLLSGDSEGNEGSTLSHPATHGLRANTYAWQKAVFVPKSGTFWGLPAG